jgi:pyruvate dehydrogenase E2 component (dihydrolipoamide acetyltransferase)
MATPIIMPKFGQMTEESAIVEWLKKEGDKVNKGDILFTVETDKSVMDVESFEEGTLLKITVPPRVNVPVQSTVGFLGKPGEAIPGCHRSGACRTETCAGPSGPRPPGAPLAPVARRLTAVPALRSQRQLLRRTRCSPARSGSSALFRISPRAAALAKHSVIDAARIKGTGPEGRVVEKDVRDYLQQHGYDKLRISPAAKELAAKEKLDVLAIQATDDSGRISVADVQRAIAEKPKPMSKMRQVIAQRLTQSFRDTPHFYVTVAVDMTELIAYRSQLKAAGAPYTVTDFIAEAVVLTLQEFPDVNSSTDGKTTRWNSHVNLGIAVSLEQGLVVPVIRNAEQLPLLELSQRTKSLAEKARAGKATPDELSGGTFTISNMGMMDVESFGAIINPGESAILAVASTRPQPVVRDGKIVVRQIMKLTLSCDHRIVDGALGAKFINAIKQKLEDIELWKRLAALSQCDLRH